MAAEIRRSKDVANSAEEVVRKCIEEARATRPRMYEMRLSAFLTCLSRETGIDLSQLYL